MKTTLRIALMSLAVAVGFGTAAMTAIAASGDDLVTICFRGRTVGVPTYLLPRYLAVTGTTIGPCVVTP
jgi:hypothetical protein